MPVPLLPDIHGGEISDLGKFEEVDVERVCCPLCKRSFMKSIIERHLVTCKRNKLKASERKRASVAFARKRRSVVAMHNNVSLQDICVGEVWPVS